MRSAEEDEEKMNRSCVAHGVITWHSYSGKYFGNYKELNV